MTSAARRVQRAAFLCAAALALAGCTLPPADRAEIDPATAPPGTYLKVGANLLALQEPDLAYDAFITAMRVDGVSAEALTGAGIATHRQGLLTTSRRYLERAVDLDPSSVTARNNLGVVLFQTKQYYPARDAFKAAYALSSGASDIAERNLNRTETVIAQIEEARLADPATSHRVVRLGTSEFRITPNEEAQAEMIGAL